MATLARINSLDEKRYEFRPDFDFGRGLFYARSYETEYVRE